MPKRAAPLGKGRARARPLWPGYSPPGCQAGAIVLTVDLGGIHLALHQHCVTGIALARNPLRRDPLERRNPHAKPALLAIINVGAIANCMSG